MTDSALLSSNIISGRFGCLTVASRGKQTNAAVKIESENVAGTHTARRFQKTFVTNFKK